MLFASRFRLSAVAVALSCLPAFAQTAADISAERQIETITVRGEKTDRSIQDTTSSVAVTTALKIEQENLQSLDDILNRTANVSAMYGSRGFTIRGIADEAGASNPLATIYLDGAALPSQIADAGPTDLWDIAQVEVMRGPQSTIQGENALAGAIVMRSAEPTMDWAAKARVQFSDPSDRRIAFAGGGPLIENELAFRVALEKRDFDGYVHNITRNEPEDAVDALSARIKLLWTPKALPGFSARLTHLRDDSEGPYMYVYSAIDQDDYYNNRINRSDAESKTDIVTDVTTLELNYQLNDVWSVSATTAKTRSDAFRSYDNDQTEQNLAYGLTDGVFDTLSQELRLHYSGDNLRALAGLYWSRREMDSMTSTLTNVVTPLSTIAAVLQGNGLDAATAQQLAALYGQALPVIPVDYNNVSPTQSENLAAFFDLEYQLSAQWTLLAGARFDTEQYDYQSDTTAEFAGTLPDPANFGAPGTALYAAFSGINNAVLGMVNDAASSVPASSRDFNAFLPKLGARWQYSAEQSLAFTVQRGYRSGGSSYNIARGEVFGYEPEFTTNYELAWRSNWLDQNLTVNSNLYYIDWTDKQVIANFGINSFDSHTVNAGKSHLYGAEFEVRQRINNQLDWYGSYAYSKTQYDEFDAIAGAMISNFSGQPFAYAPRHTAALGANWYPADNWALNVNSNFRSKVSTGPRDSTLWLSSRALFNARLSYDSTNWSAYLFVNNLFDKGYTQYHWAGEQVAIFGAPRVVGAGLQWQW
ncbi:TonB-dependent receptor [Rheinheimera aquimaris]|uniref:TonB-dependent receptor n=1 Tax=Rheinheimera aquimaris TaxID=412437 RepID=A0ABP3NIH0_9GAMM|nr:TonB-dependent receptor [Rheinheimera aquimaris]MCB5212979.1 TonB-dependent receptor [Rheinheimera aquimaris]